MTTKELLARSNVQLEALDANGDFFAFGLSAGRASADDAAAIDTIATGYGIFFFQAADGYCFIMNREQAAVDGYAKDMLIDCENAGLLQAVAWGRTG